MLVVKVMDQAAKNGHLEVIKWLHMNRTEGCTGQAILQAASNGPMVTYESNGRLYYRCDGSGYQKWSFRTSQMVTYKSSRKVVP
jgi:hypothetical protein